MGRYIWGYDLCISLILGFPDQILNGTRYKIADFEVVVTIMCS